MNAKVDQFTDKLRDRLNTIESRLESAKADMQSLANQGEQALRLKLDEARAKIHAQKERVDQARANLTAWGQQKLAETTEAVSQWKAKRETRKLNARADRAEAYAADAIEYAVASIDEAAAAILDAVVTRLDADAAK
jgi:hypothetical protein